MQEPSVFTRIINGEIPSYKIYEDDHTIAVLTDRPAFDGHTLVIPKSQVDNIWDLSESDYDHLMKAARKIGANIRKKLKCPRVAMVVEGFNIPHAHIHLYPVYNRGDARKADRMSPDDKNLSKIAQKLRISQ